MYLAHFGLKEFPFSLTPDTSFFFAHAGAQAALNTLLVALRDGQGFVKVVAEVGCGKTLLCRRLLASLSEDFETAYIPNPAFDANTMLRAVCEELNLQVAPDQSAHQVVRELRHCLLKHAEASRRVVLIIDEAQTIPDETVETLRLLSNIETEKRKLLQIVLIGQPELDTKLTQVHLRQLLQRITFSDHIAPMAKEDVGAYVRYRMEVAGSSRIDIFESAAISTLAERSGGVPRIVNVLAHKALMLAFGEGVSHVTAAHVKSSISDTAAVRYVASDWWTRAWRAVTGSSVPGRRQS